MKDGFFPFLGSSRTGCCLKKTLVQCILHDLGPLNWSALLQKMTRTSVYYYFSLCLLISHQRTSRGGIKCVLLKTNLDVASLDAGGAA